VIGGALAVQGRRLQDGISLHDRRALPEVKKSALLTRDGILISLS
jgi:hypothetical protein